MDKSEKAEADRRAAALEVFNLQVDLAWSLSLCSVAASMAAMEVFGGIEARIDVQLAIDAARQALDMFEEGRQGIAAATELALEISQAAAVADLTARVQALWLGAALATAKQSGGVQ